MTFKLMQLMLFLYMYVHLIACLWFYSINLKKDWMPPTDFVFYETDLYDNDTTLSWKYWISFYTSVFLLTGGEVGPRDSYTASLSSTLIIIGAVITAIMFGEMAVLMT